MHEAMLGDGSGAGAGPLVIDAEAMRRSMEAAEARAEAEVAAKSSLGMQQLPRGRLAAVAAAGAAAVVHHHHHHHHHFHTHALPPDGGSVAAAGAGAAGAAIAVLAAAAATTAAAPAHGGSFSPTMDLLSGIRHHASPGGGYAAAPHVHSRAATPGKDAAVAGSPERSVREAPAPVSAAAGGAEGGAAG